MARRSALRASDSDREQAAERLRDAAGEGRLLASELEDRLGAAFSARTYGELDALVADLPAPHPSRRERSSLLPWLPPVVALAIAIPIALLVLAAVAFVLTGLFAAWGLWLFLGWWVFAGRRRGYVRGPRRSGPGPYAVRRTQPRPDHWH